MQALRRVRAAAIGSFRSERREESRSHRNDIQGLRAVAVVLVVLNHAGVSFLKGGYIGVDVFFVLSGFLITGLLSSGAARNGYASIGEFYARRARRILPAAALTLVVTDIVALSVLNFIRAKAVLQDSIPASLFAANFHFASQGTNYFARGQPPSPIQHFWSLGVEEQFYLAWPLILLVVLLGFTLRARKRAVPVSQRHQRPPVTSGGLRRLDLTIGVIVLTSLAWSIYYTQAHPTSSYFSTLTRAWELGLGAALALAATRLARTRASWRALIGWIGIAAILAAAVRFSSSTPFPGYAALLPTGGTVLVILAGLGRKHSRLSVGRVLSVAPMRYIGDRSYSFYLWHWPALVIALQHEGHNLPLGTNLLLLAGAFLLSIVSYALFENPIRRLRWRSPNRALVLWPASVAAVLLVAGWGIGRSDTTATRLASTGAPLYPGYVADNLRAGEAASSGPQQQLLLPSPNGGPLPAVIAAVHAARRGAAVPAVLTPRLPALDADYFNVPDYCSPALDKSRDPVCTYASSSAKHTLVVFGDSHAQMWMPAVLHMAAKDGWLVRAVWKSGCSPAQWWNPATSTGACRAWFPWAVRRAEALHAGVTLLALDQDGLGGHSRTAPGLTSLITGMKSASKQVVVLGDEPPPTRKPVDCLLGANATMSTCAFHPTPAAISDAQIVESTSIAAGAKFVDTRGWFCYENLCPMVVGHTVAPRDTTGHITTSYAAALGEVFRRAFRSAIGIPPPAAAAQPTGATGGGALPAVVGAAQAARRGAPIPSGLTPPVSSLLSDHYNYPSGCAAQDGQSSVSVCALGDTSAKKSLVLMGDSHAQMWMPSILSLAQKEGWTVHPIGKSACIPLAWWRVTKATSDCRAWYAWAQHEIATLHPDVTILAGAFTGLAGYDGPASTGMRSLVSSLRSSSKHVVVLADPPAQTQQPVDCLLSPAANMARCSLAPAPSQLDIRTVIGSAARRAGAGYVDTSGWFCFENECPMVIGHTIAYTDPGHVTTTYGLQLADPFRAAFDRAISSGGQP